MAPFRSRAAYRRASPRRAVWAIALVGVLAAGGLLLPGTPRTATVSALGSPGDVGSVGAGSPAAIPTPTNTSTEPATGSSPFSSRAATVEADRSALVSSGGNLSRFEPPTLREAVPISETDGRIQPLFGVAPAPMGLAYYGLQNRSGVVHGSVLNTTSLRGYFRTNDTLGVETESFDLGPSTTFGIQLNAVFTNVTIDGKRAFGPNPNAPQGCTGFFTGSEANWCPNQFWLQNVATYNPTTRQLELVDNIWNFSDPSVSWATSNGITLEGRTTPLGGYYAVAGPVFTIAYPFTLVLYLNSTVGRCQTAAPGASSCARLHGGAPVNEVFFNYTLLNANGQVVCPTLEPENSVCGEYDDVFWNSAPRSGGAHGPSFRTATMVADGTQYDPAGLTNDWEMDVGIGSSDGATTSVVYADADVGLAYCPAAQTIAASGRCASYAATPAAYDYGGDTGETSQGEDSYYVTDGHGISLPPSLGGPGTPVARLVTGPSLLRGLWNLSTPSGAYALDVARISPSNAWVAVAAGANQTNQSRFGVAPTFGWYSARAGSGGSHRPTMLGPNLYLAPGRYTVEVLLSGYAPAATTVDLRSAAATPTISLTRNAATGAYTPLWAFGPSDLANLSFGGNGTSAAPYQLVNGTASSGLPYGVYGSVAEVFAGLNDFLYPVWLGAFLNGTHAYATFDAAPSFAVRYPVWELPALKRFDAPPTNGLEYYLDRAQNVSVVGATNLSVWASLLAAPVAAVVCDACFNDLFAQNRFGVTDIGLELTGETGSLRPLAAAANDPHSRNVVWGNTFALGKLAGYGGIEAPTDFVRELDSNDRLYNNDFDGNVSVADTLAYDAWNVTCQAGYAGRSTGYYPGPLACQPASAVASMNGFVLTGSLDGTAYQGGNLWQTFGDYANPYANVPYVARSTGPYDSPGIGVPGGVRAGDFAPLLPFRVYAVTFAESGLSTAHGGVLFEVALRGGVGWQNETPTGGSAPTCGSAPCVEFFAPNGTFGYEASTTAKGFVASPRLGSVAVSGAALGPVSVAFARAHSLTLTFHETGIPAGHHWCAVVASFEECTVAGKLKFGGLVVGTYSYALVRPAGNLTARLGRSVVPLSGSLDLVRSVTIRVTYLYTYAVTFYVDGGEYFAAWAIHVGGKTFVNPAGPKIVVELGNGTYRFHVLPIRGRTITGGTGSVRVEGVGNHIQIEIT